MTEDKHAKKQKYNYKEPFIMKHLSVLIAAIWMTCPVVAQEIQYTKTDSVKVAGLLQQAQKLDSAENVVIYFARELKGIPYVAKTLEKNETEKLVVNLRQLDCTTYVENVLALSLCAKNNRKRFEDFCTYLRLIRYRNGEISYINRLHYFTEWIADNTRMGYVAEVQEPNPPFTGLQKLMINYMSTYPQYYPMLQKNPAWIKGIKAMEDELNGQEYRYIPKNEIANTAIYRETIRSGDIIAIITSRKGLDTSHIGIAVWHKDGLHLLNASSVRHKVIEEPMLLRTYMNRHPSQVGIRIIRIR